jgi:flagella basal body P-ring formation protein FlgA
MAAAPVLRPAESTNAAVSWRLLPNAQVRAAGVHLNEVAESSAGPLPGLRLAAAPAVGQAAVLSRTQLLELVRQNMPELLPINWTGANQVRVTRRSRPMDEAEVKELIRAALQRDFVKERGELEIRFSRPWATIPIPDEAFTLNIVDLPSAGVTPNFVVRFELRSGTVPLGTWQVPLLARIWREVWVAGSALQRGQLLRDADVVQEKRDVLVVRDALGSLVRDDAHLELAENLSAGAPLTPRSLRMRPIVRRGGIVEALIEEGAMTISVKAEALEDGLPGQTIRARNLKSKREFRGKVQNEETIVVAL